jgi:hypothetical protein
MIKKGWLLFLLLCVLKINAQYTDIINSNRPGLSESPFSVGLKVLQIESGLRSSFFKDQKINNSLKNRRFEQQFRFGLITERLEFSVTTFQDFNSVSNDLYDDIGYFGYGLSAGTKFLIYKHNIEDTYEDKLEKMRSWNRKSEFDWNRLIPSVGISVSGTFDISPPELPIINAYDPYNPSALSSFQVALLLQNDLNNYWSVNTNFIYERTFYSENRFFGVMSSNYVVNKRWAVFAEGRGQLKPHFQVEAEAGAAYLFNTNLQIDGGIHTGFTSQGTILGFSTGFTWRIDNHVDKYTDFVVNEDGELVPATEEKGNNFFNNPEKELSKATKSVGGFFKRFGQNTKHAFKVAGVASGNFFRNLFKKKENRIFKDYPKKESNSKELVKPSKGKNFKKEYLKHHGELLEEDVDSTNSKKQNFFSRLFKKKDSISDQSLNENQVESIEKEDEDNILEPEEELKTKEKKKGFFSKLFKKKDTVSEEEDIDEDSADSIEDIKAENKSADELTEEEKTVSDKPKKKKKGFFSKLFKKKDKDDTDTEEIPEQTPQQTED